MRALLIVAHGSRRRASNTEVMEVARAVASGVGAEFDIVEAAFLELAEPDIPTGIRRCIERGATALSVVPYFLAAGRHVVNDIPDIVDALRAEFPAVDISVAQHVGASAMMPELIKQCAASR